jgi:uncharacterized membrane protein YkoI
MRAAAEGRAAFMFASCALGTLLITNPDAKEAHTMRKRNIAGLAATAALALAAVGAVANAETPPPSASPAIGQPQAPKSPKPAETQEPKLSGSITVPQTADTGTENEAAEQAALAALAKINEADARNAALAKFPGATVQKAALGDENGTLIWEVALTDASGGAQEVKVDAGNAAILAVEAGGAESEKAGTEKD